MSVKVSRRWFIGGLASLGAFGGNRVLCAPAGKFTGGKPNLAFGVVSDVHVRLGLSGEGFAKDSDPSTFIHTLEWFRDQHADAVMIVGDIADKAVLEDFARQVIETHGRVDVLINNAPPDFIGIDSCSYEQFQRSLAVGVTAPFYLSKLFAPYFAPGASILNISSSRDRMSQPQSESYTAAKGGIAALTHSLAVSLAGNLLNFALNLLGCYVHDLRLQCLEFFNRFYQEGGRPFRPLEVETKYVDVVEE